MDQAAMMSFLNEVMQTVAWALVGAVSMGISLGLLIKFFDWMTPVNEWNQIKNGNIAMGLVLASVVISFGFVISCTLIPTEFNIQIITAAAKAVAVG